MTINRLLTCFNLWSLIVLKRWFSFEWWNLLFSAKCWISWTDASITCFYWVNFEHHWNKLNFFFEELFQLVNPTTTTYNVLFVKTKWCNPVKNTLWLMRSNIASSSLAEFENCFCQINSFPTMLQKEIDTKTIMSQKGKTFHNMVSWI